jgi:hypothetical protein
MIFKPKKKTKGFREWVAWKLVDLARWIKPENEAATAFLVEIITELELEKMKYGKAELEIKVKKHE